MLTQDGCTCTSHVTNCHYVLCLSSRIISEPRSDQLPPLQIAQRTNLSTQFFSTNKPSHLWLMRSQQIKSVSTQVFLSRCSKFETCIFNNQSQTLDVMWGNSNIFLWLCYHHCTLDLVLHPEDVPVLPYISIILQISALPAHSIFTIIWLLTMTLKSAGL